MSKIEDNKKEFISIAKTITREGVDSLLDWLETTDFYTAPASYKYHSSFEGGLCQHSLNVYRNMIKLKEQFCPQIPDETCKIVALFHDVAKVNFYEKTVKNTKVYSPTGSKSDEMGRFDWVAVAGYSVIPEDKRDFVCHIHAVNSYILINKHMKLTMAEVAAITNHHFGADDYFAVKDISEVVNRYPAAGLLHMADFLATYINENPYMINE